TIGLDRLLLPGGRTGRARRRARRGGPLLPARGRSGAPLPRRLGRGRPRGSGGGRPRGRGRRWRGRPEGAGRAARAVALEGPGGGRAAGGGGLAGDLGGGRDTAGTRRVDPRGRGPGGRTRER